MQNIVVGVDDTAAAKGALAWAVAEATLREARLRVVHAVPYASAARPLHRPDVAEHLLVRIVEEVATGDLGPGRITKETVGGAPDAILATASLGADLLVVGSHARSTLDRVVLGSVSSGAVHRAACPVAVIPLEPPDRRRSGIVVGMDGSEGALRALVWALDEARRRHAKVSVVHSRMPYPTESGWDEYSQADADGELKRMVDSVLATEAEGVDVELHAVLTQPRGALLAASANAELLVVGRRGAGWLRRVVLGSVSTACVHRSSGPVVVVPSDHLPR